MKNNIRFDLSDYLIHFFRDVDMDGPNAIVLPEQMGWHTLIEDQSIPAILMLRSALRNGRLWATWSYRNEVRTIYGPHPAVCFTDMPIAAFVEASRARHARGEAMGEIALVFPKKTMRSLGARPAIYGVSQQVASWPDGAGGSHRLLPPTVLPLEEQYRFVTDGYPIDWTHEREWRWPSRTARYPVPEDGVDEWSDIPGLDLYQEEVKGMGAIVKTRSQAKLVVSDMLTMVDSGQSDPRAFSFVLVTDELPSLSALRDRENLQSALEQATINIDKYFYVKDKEVTRINEEFNELVLGVERSSPPPERGEEGQCWLWVYDGASDIARHLIALNRLVVSRNGRYLAVLPEFSHSRGLAQREEMTQRLAELVKNKFGIDCGYFSVKDSFDPDAVPFYAENHDTDISYYNATWMYT
ncbi:DUF4427 domain-containing protein [Xanthomonas campestris pv. campestris]|nr:DUF4427 domain-containing protein [Xanthomonas campestris pv. campestris]